MAKELNNTWIKIYRGMLDWEWFEFSEMVHLFLYLLLKANIEDKNWRGVLIKRGQLATSNATLRKDLHLTERQIRTCIKRLISTKEITYQATNKYVIITICNYERYQENKTISDEQNDEQATIKGRASDEQATTTKEIKNIRINSLPNGKEPIEGKTDPIPYSEIQDMWNNTCVSFPQIVKLTDPRKHKIKLRLQEMAGKEKDMEKALVVLKQVFTLAEKSNFLKGDNNRGWTATFDWVIENPKNWVKIIEGNYKNTDNNGQQKQSSISDLDFISAIANGIERGLNKS
jgi:hypothetical protein